MSLRKSIQSSSETNLQHSDSVVNLTKPQLFSFYNNNDSSLNLNEQDLLLIEKKKQENLQKINNQHDQPIKFSWLTKVIVVLIASFAYDNILSHIKIDNDQLINNRLQLSNKLVMDIIHWDLLGGLFFQGVCFSLVVPLLDWVWSPGSYRLLSSNPNRFKFNKSLINELVRSCLTFLGINYAIRNLNWSSFLQISIVWSMLNPGLWLLLDGTVNGFLGSLLVATLVCSAVYWKNHHLFSAMIWDGEFLAIWLWIGSFIFGGGIVFGKIGRCLK